MFKQITTLVLAIIFMLFSGSGRADSVSTSTGHAISFNLQLITAAASLYFYETGTAPGSVNDLYQAGWVPGNLINPMTGNPLDYNAVECGPGDIVITPVNSTYSTITIFGPDGELSTFDLNEEFCWVRPSYNLRGADLIIANYSNRIQTALIKYWVDYDDIPYSIEDMQLAGFWPFDGTEVNPLTNEPLDFFSSDDGNLDFRFDPDEVVCTIHYENGRIAWALIDRVQFSRAFWGY
ncbi:hypothetical protein KAU08_11540 [bacterium]|nr:hypothetical protein [bacterium]